MTQETGRPDGAIIAGGGGIGGNAGVGGIGGNAGERPLYDAGKSPLAALGFVRNLMTAAADFARVAEAPLPLSVLEANIRAAYEAGELLYYEYGPDGNPVACDTFSPRTCAFALPTGGTDRRQDPLYARYNRGAQGCWIGVQFQSPKRIFNELNSYRIGTLSFRNFEAANAFITDLHGELQPGETWSCAEPFAAGKRRRTDFEILESYLRTVLAALMQEHNRPESPNFNKIRLSQDGRFALFNTGLLSGYATDILVIGEVYRHPETGEIRFLSNPVPVKNGITQLHRAGFSAADAEVDMVSFFTDISQILYDATAKVDVEDLGKLRHCIDEGIRRGRFPEACRQLYEQGRLEALTNTFVSEIRRAERIARRNYKYVVPQYRTTPSGNSIQFLMPIYMQANYDGSPDFALALSEHFIDGKRFYKPETVLELAWAYNNARALCKPESSWLAPGRVAAADGAEYED